MEIKYLDVLKAASAVGYALEERQRAERIHEQDQNDSSAAVLERCVRAEERVIEMFNQAVEQAQVAKSEFDAATLD